MAYNGRKFAGGAAVLDEVIYMQVRLFRMFLEHTGLPSREGNRVFHGAGVWDFISMCYDSLHLSGDESALSDVFARIEHAVVSW